MYRSARSGQNRNSLQFRDKITVNEMERSKLRAVAASRK
jgi:hypothetical protein